MNLIKLFENAINRNRLSHLYLLTTKQGVNIKDKIDEISYLVLKDHDLRSNLKDLIKDNNHSQIMYIKPETNVIKKEQILNLQKEFSKTSLINAPRIYIIESVDLISIEAANSLLKFMEEPENSSVLGILTSTNVSKVMPTIISRAQVIRVLDENKDDIYNALLEDEVSSYIAKSISYLTNDLTEAKELVHDLNLIQVIEFIFNYFYEYNNRSLLDLNPLTNIIADRKLYQRFIELMIINYNELIKYKLDTNIFLVDIINDNNSKLENKHILRNIELLKNELIKQNSYININLSLDVLMINLMKK